MCVCEAGGAGRNQSTERKPLHLSVTHSGFEYVRKKKKKSQRCPVKKTEHSEDQRHTYNRIKKENKRKHTYTLSKNNKMIKHCHIKAT